MCKNGTPWLRVWRKILTSGSDFPPRLWLSIPMYLFEKTVSGTRDGLMKNKSLNAQPQNWGFFTLMSCPACYDFVYVRPMPHSRHSLNIVRNFRNLTSSNITTSGWTCATQSLPARYPASPGFYPVPFSFSDLKNGVMWSPTRFSYHL